MTATPTAPRIFWLGETAVDLANSELRRGGEVIPLTPTEVGLLEWLAAHAGRDVDRGTLLTEVWHYKPGLNTRAPDFTVFRLRRKIEVDPSEPRFLVSAPARGYRLVGLVEDGVETGLVGRQALMTHLRRWLGGPPGVVVLHGPGGVGKTSLARALCREASGVWVELRSAEHPDAARQGLAAALGCRPVDVWRAARGRKFVVLDNVEQILGSVEQLLGEVADQPPCHVVVTSQIASQGLPNLTVPPLDPAEGLALLQARFLVPLRGDHRALIEALGGLPLAIEHAARHLEALDLSALAGLAKGGANVSFGGPGGDGHGSLSQVLAWSWRWLDEPGRDLVASVAAFSVPPSVERLAGLRGEAPALTAGALLGLSRHHWLVRVDDGHGLAPPVARWLAHAEPLRWERWRAAHSRWALSDEAPLVERLRALDLEPDPQARRALARALDAEIFAPDESFGHRVQRLDRVLADHPTDAWLRWARGLAQALGGQVGGAREDLALALAGAREARDPLLEGRCLGQLGNLAGYHGDPAGAAPMLRDAVRVLGGAGFAQESAVFLGNLGSVLVHLGQLEEAGEAFVEALARMGTRHKPVNRGRIYNNLGNVLSSSGDDLGADRAYDQAESLFREAGDDMVLAQFLGNLALRRLGQGDLPAVGPLLAEALATHERLGNVRSAGHAWLTQGDLEVEQGQLGALDRFAQARACFEEVDDRRLLGWTAFQTGRARAGSLASPALPRPSKRASDASARSATPSVWPGPERPSPPSSPAPRGSSRRGGGGDPVAEALWALVQGRPVDPAWARRSHDFRLLQGLIARTRR